MKKAVKATLFGMIGGVAGTIIIRELVGILSRNRRKTNPELRRVS
jgi:hypothetical protein